MIRMELKDPSGIVIDGRVAKHGQVAEFDQATAAELFANKAAIPLIRIRIVRANLLIGSQAHATGEVVEVHTETAHRLVEGKFATLEPMKAARAGLNIGSGREGDAIKPASAAQAAELYATGMANYAEASTAPAGRKR